MLKLSLVTTDVLIEIKQQFIKMKKCILYYNTKLSIFFTEIS